MYIVTGTFKFQKNKMSDAQRLMDSMVSLGKTEVGMHKYSFYSEQKSLNIFFLYEEWESKSAHDKHFHSESMKKMLPDFFELLDEEPEVTYYNAEIESKL